MTAVLDPAASAAPAVYDDLAGRLDDLDHTALASAAQDGAQPPPSDT